MGASFPRTCESDRPQSWQADWTVWTSGCLVVLTMPPWGIFMSPRRWEGRVCATAGHLSNIQSVKESHRKSITVVDLGPKGRPEISMLPLTGPQDVRQVKGSLEEVLSQGSRGELSRLCQCDGYRRDRTLQPAGTGGGGIRPPAGAAHRQQQDKTTAAGHRGGHPFSGPLRRFANFTRRSATVP